MPLFLSSVLATLLLYCLPFADDIGYLPESNPPPQTSSRVTNTLILSDSNSAPAIRQLNDYSLQQEILSLFGMIKYNFEDRINYEIQYGLGAYKNFDLDDVTSSHLLSIKLNLFNPKIILPKVILARISKMRHLLSIKPFSFSQSIENECLQMEKKIREYQSHFWWKRLSIGVTLPSAYADTTAENGYNNSFPGFRIHEPLLFIGYDFGDLVSLTLGASDKAVYFGTSIDISTPVYVGTGKFINVLTGLRDIHGTGNYYSSSYY